MNANEKAELLLHERHLLGDQAFAELRIWRLPRPVRGSRHLFKYALAYVVAEACVLRYDNEAGKGDHHHLGETQIAYDFITPEKLLTDFWKAIEQWRLE
ncbi:MAG: toxin-antitoxin system TumE family protein [Caulobacteraceae bacterium]